MITEEVTRYQSLSGYGLLREQRILVTDIFSQAKMGSPNILSYKQTEGDWDDSLVHDEQIIHELANGTRMINLSLLRLVQRWNPLFVAHGYTYASIDKGWRYSRSRKNSEWPVLQHMAMRPQDCYASKGPQSLQNILMLYKQGLTTRKSNFTRVQEIL
jgi:hypothetical protein